MGGPHSITSSLRKFSLLFITSHHAFFLHDAHTSSTLHVINATTGSPLKLKSQCIVVNYVFSAFQPTEYKQLLYQADFVAVSLDKSAQIFLIQ